MRSWLSVLAGLVAGVLVAIGLLAGFIFVGPDPVQPRPSASASASAPVSTPSPAGQARASASASIATSAAPSSSGSGASQDAEAANFHIGRPAPPLLVPQVGGGMIDLASMKGKAVWLNFMQTTCPACIHEFPLMNGYAGRYGDDGLIIVAIDIREEEDAVAAFANGLNAIFPLGLDTDGTAQRDWGAFALPVHFWVDREGIVRDGALGGIGSDVMADGVRAILPGVTVTP